MLLDTDRDRNIDFLGKKVSIFCRTHIAVGHRIQGGRPGPLRLRSAADYDMNLERGYVFSFSIFAIPMQICDFARKR